MGGGRTQQVAQPHSGRVAGCEKEQRMQAAFWGEQEPPADLSPENHWESKGCSCPIL